jgi:hypothetical protein
VPGAIAGGAADSAGAVIGWRRGGPRAEIAELFHDRPMCSPKTFSTIFSMAD